MTPLPSQCTPLACKSRSLQRSFLADQLRRKGSNVVFQHSTCHRHGVLRERLAVATLETPVVINDERLPLEEATREPGQESNSTSGLLRPSFHVFARKAQEELDAGHIKEEVVQPTRVTPEKLSELGRVLGLNARDAQELVHEQPLLLQLTAREICIKISSFAAVLGSTDQQVATALRLQPWLWEGTAEDVKGRVDALTAAIGVARPLVALLCVSAPSVLRRQPAALASRLQHLAAMLDTSVEHVVTTSCTFTQLLTIEGPKAERRVQGVALSLGVHLSAAKALTAKHPTLMFLSTRILLNKVKVLQAILDQSQREVGMLVLRCPDLLQASMDRVRKVYEKMQGYLDREPEFTYAMVCSNPRLLLMKPWLLRKRAMMLQQCACYSRRWIQDWEMLTPFNAACCLMESLSTYQRLQYLLHVGLSETLSLTAVLMANKSVFLKLHPEFQLWQQQRGKLVL